MTTVHNAFDFPDDPCPFGPSPVMLEGRDLTASEKLWFGRIANRANVRQVDLARSFHISYRLIRKWAGLYRKGIMPQERQGRPRSLDSIGLLEARQETGQLGHRDYRAISRIIKKNYQRTLNRRYFLSTNNGSAKLTSRSVDRYRPKVVCAHMENDPVIE